MQKVGVLLLMCMLVAVWGCAPLQPAASQSAASASSQGTGSGANAGKPAQSSVSAVPPSARQPAAVGESAWMEEDFQFYNQDGKPMLYPTVDDYWVRMSEGDALKTYRGLYIGARGTDIAKLYDLTDFEWSIADFGYINPSTEKSEAFEAKWQGKSTQEVLDSLPAVAAQSLDTFVYCDVYMQNGKLITYSQLDFSKMDEECADTKEQYREMEFLQRHLKYSISFTIDGEIVSDVSVESNYHNHAQVAYDKNGELSPLYTWLKELE